MTDTSTKKRTKKGIVVSNKAEQTIVVKVDTYKAHPKYKKKFRVSKKFYAHVDDSSKIEEGKEVIIEKMRPMSKLKRWKFVDFVEDKSKS